MFPVAPVIDRSHTSLVDSTNGITTGALSSRVPNCHLTYRENAAYRLADEIGWFQMNSSVSNIHAGFTTDRATGTRRLQRSRVTAASTPT